MRVGGREPGPHQPGQGAQRDNEEGAGPHRWHHAGKVLIPNTTGQFFYGHISFIERTQY